MLKEKNRKKNSTKKEKKIKVTCHINDPNHKIGINKPIEG